MQRVGVLLAGCGARDGSDIHEVVLLALALERARARVVYLALPGGQADVVDHASGVAAEGAAPREVFVESARLARGRIEPLDDAALAALPALVLPGGLGVLKQMFDDVLVIGRRPRLKPDLSQQLGAARQRGLVLAGVGLAHLALEELAGELGLDPLLAPASRALVDHRRRIVWTPGMLTALGLDEAAAGLTELVVETMALAGRRWPGAPALGAGESGGRTD